MEKETNLMRISSQGSEQSTVLLKLNNPYKTCQANVHYECKLTVQSGVHAMLSGVGGPVHWFTVPVCLQYIKWNTAKNVQGALTDIPSFFVWSHSASWICRHPPLEHKNEHASVEQSWTPKQAVSWASGGPVFQELVVVVIGSVGVGNPGSVIGGEFSGVVSTAGVVSTTGGVVVVTSGCVWGGVVGGGGASFEPVSCKPVSWGDLFMGDR